MSKKALFFIFWDEAGSTTDPDWVKSRTIPERVKRSPQSCQHLREHPWDAVRPTGPADTNEAGSLWLWDKTMLGLRSGPGSRALSNEGHVGEEGARVPGDDFPLALSLWPGQLSSTNKENPAFLYQPPEQRSREMLPHDAMSGAPCAAHFRACHCPLQWTHTLEALSRPFSSGAV